MHVLAMNTHTPKNIVYFSFFIKRVLITHLQPRYRRRPGRIITPFAAGRPQWQLLRATGSSLLVSNGTVFGERSEVISRQSLL